MFTSLECCGGRQFVIVPFVGLFEAQFTAALTLFISIVIGLLLILRKHWFKLLSLLTIICGIGMKMALSSSGHENGVKGWLQALDMAKVDTDSVAVVWSPFINQHFISFFFFFLGYLFFACCYSFCPTKQ